MSSPRIIFHVDMDAFFVSVEELYEPSLRGKPVIIGGGPQDRGVVSAASYAARRWGVHSAMPLRTAYRLCPQGIFLPGHPQRYREHSRLLFQVLQSFTPKVEMASIDEAYLDMTGLGRLYGPPLEAASRLRQRVKETTGLNCSIGAGTSRIVAKVASDQAKPNGVLYVFPGLEAEFLAPLPVLKLPGVGRVTAQQLAALGIRLIGHVQRLEPSLLAEVMGQWGAALAGKARGEDAGGWFDTDIGGSEDPKSISHEHTFSEDTSDPAVLEATLSQLSAQVARRLRDHGLYARTVQIKVRYSDFSTITRALTLESATQLDIDLIEYSRWLFRRNWSGKEVRLLGVYAGTLTGTEGQLSLLDADRRERWRRVLAAMDALRGRFGADCVGVASSLSGRWREKVHENPADLEGKARRPG
jgi:DNA polymerase-4